MSRRKVTFVDSTDWGCERTEEDVERWHARMLRALQKAYPRAEVEIKTGWEMLLRVNGERVDNDIPDAEWEEFCLANFDAKVTP